MTEKAKPPLYEFKCKRCGDDISTYNPLGKAGMCAMCQYLASIKDEQTRVELEKELKRRKV